MIEKKFKATENDINTRLDTYVSSLNLALSRTIVKKLIINKKIFVNDKNVKESYKIKKGDIVGRISYDKDILFVVERIINTKSYLFTVNG